MEYNQIQDFKDSIVLSHILLFVISWTEPIRLFYPWDSPSKNTEVGCHFHPEPRMEPTKSPASAGRFFITELLEIAYSYFPILRGENKSEIKM